MKTEKPPVKIIHDGNWFSCEKCGDNSFDEIADVIIHLNDEERCSFEEIANAIEDLDLPLEPIVECMFDPLLGVMYSNSKVAGT
jgi:hypothetical protein